MSLSVVSNRCAIIWTTLLSLGTVLQDIQHPLTLPSYAHSTCFPSHCEKKKKQNVSLGPKGNFLIAEGRRRLKKEIAKIKLKGLALIQLAYCRSRSRMRDVTSHRGKKERDAIYFLEEKYRNSNF